MHGHNNMNFPSPRWPGYKAAGSRVNVPPQAWHHFPGKTASCLCQAGYTGPSIMKGAILCLHDPMGAELSSLSAALPPAPPLVNLPNTSSIFPPSHKHPYTYHSRELKKYFPILFMNLAKYQCQNMTKRIWEKTFLVNFTPRYGCKTPKQHISKSNPENIYIYIHISWQNWAFSKFFKVVLLFGNQLIHKINSSKEKKL